MNREILTLDTSVVMRLLVQEPADLHQTAAVVLEEKLTSQVPVHVCDLVLAEAYFALQAFYGMPKAASLDILIGFAATDGLIFPPHARAVLATRNLAKAKPGFVGRLRISRESPWMPKPWKPTGPQVGLFFVIHLCVAIPAVRDNPQRARSAVGKTLAVMVVNHAIGIAFTFQARAVMLPIVRAGFSDQRTIERHA